MSDVPTNEELLLLRQRRLSKRKRILSVLDRIGRTVPVPLRQWLSRRDPRLAYLRLPDGDFVIRDYLGEFSVRINVARSDIEREMLSGGYEGELRNLLKPHLHTGDTVIDVGANVGALTFYFAQSVGPAGQVLAFEPGPSFFERLQANLGLNPRVQGRVQAFRKGLSSAPGQLFWNEDPEFPGNAWMLAKSGTPVPVSTLDTECASLTRCSLIKIDVEGMELEVLRGAEQLLKRLRPKIILETSLEFEAIRGEPVRRETEVFLLALGYRLYALESHGQLRPVHYPDFPMMSLAVPG